MPPFISAYPSIISNLPSVTLPPYCLYVALVYMDSTPGKNMDTSFVMTSVPERLPVVPTRKLDVPL